MQVGKSLVALLCAVAVGHSARLSAETGDLVPAEELATFLGPVPPDRFTWRVVPGPDFVVYYGNANAPLSGSVGFYLGYAPQDLQPGTTTVRSRLGKFRVKWHRRTTETGAVHQEAMIAFPGDIGVKAHVWAEAANEKDLDALLSIVGQLPTFTSGPAPSPLDREIVREARIRRLTWLVWWAPVLAGGYLVDRNLRRRRAGSAMRLFAFGGVAAAWLPLVIALLWATAYAIGNANWVIDRLHLANGLALFGLTAALAALALLLAGALLLLRLARRSSGDAAHGRSAGR